MKNLKKLMVVILALVMVLSMLTVAFADSTTPQVYTEGTLSAYSASYSFTAPGNGVLTITIDNADPGFDIGVNYDWKQGGASGEYSWEVEEGVEYAIDLYGYDPESSWNVEATYDYSITYTGEGEVVPYVPGSSANDPITLYMNGGSVTVPANTTLYYMISAFMSFDQKSLTVNGETGFAVIMYNSFPTSMVPDTDGSASAFVSGSFNGYAFAIQNSTNESQTYTYSLTALPGTDSNPDSMIIGTNTTTTFGNYNGYFYLWTAEEDGVLTITMTEDTWTYFIIHNGEQTTEGQLWHDDDTVVASQEIIVDSYDQITVWINTYDPDNMYAPNPAEEFSFDATFVAAPVCGTCYSLAEHYDEVHATCHGRGVKEHWYCEECAVCYSDSACTTVIDESDLYIDELGSDNILHHTYHAPTCDAEGHVEYWYCQDCNGYYLDSACTILTNAMSVKLAPEHTIVHAEAKAAGCEEEGHVEHWYCSVCGATWLDEDCTLVSNQLSVKIGITHDLVHVEAKDPTCLDLGNIEYWYCEDCGYAWLDEYCRLNTNQLAVKLPTLDHTIKHVEAKAPTATENGNIEHWYCEVCGFAWLDEECHLNTNLLAVVLPPDTGDSNVTVICAIAALLAVTGMAVVVVNSKKRSF